MNIVPDGSIITYQGIWPWGGIHTTCTSRFTTISSDLTARGLPVRSFDLECGIFFVETYKVTMQVQIANGLGFGKVEDVISIIRNAVWRKEGKFPLSDSVIAIQRPSESRPVPTGQPAFPEKPPQDKPKGCISGTSVDANGNFSLSCFFENLKTKTLSATGILAIVAGLIFATVLLAQRRL